MPRIISFLAEEDILSGRGHVRAHVLETGAREAGALPDGLDLLEDAAAVLALEAHSVGLRRGRLAALARAGAAVARAVRAHAGAAVDDER